MLGKASGELELRMGIWQLLWRKGGQYNNDFKNSTKKIQRTRITLPEDLPNWCSKGWPISMDLYLSTLIKVECSTLTNSQIQSKLTHCQLGKFLRVSSQKFILLSLTALIAASYDSLHWSWGQVVLLDHLALMVMPGRECALHSKQHQIRCASHLQMSQDICVPPLQTFKGLPLFWHAG